MLIGHGKTERKHKVAKTTAKLRPRTWRPSQREPDRMVEVVFYSLLSLTGAAAGNAAAFENVGKEESAYLAARSSASFSLARAWSKSAATSYQCKAVSRFCSTP